LTITFALSSNCSYHASKFGSLARGWENILCSNASIFCKIRHKAKLQNKLSASSLNSAKSHIEYWKTI